jgi:dTDP-4-dehydrorhamnose reductase
MTERVLLTGATGFLGRYLIAARPQEVKLHGIGFKHFIPGEDAIMHQADLKAAATVQKLLNSIRPQAIIHTAAISDANYCEQHPDESYAVNVAATRHLAEWCAEKGARFLFTSSDLVFDGEHAPYSESDRPNPLMVYGRHKAEAEEAVRSICPKGTICRLPLMFGMDGTDSRNTLTVLLGRLGKGETIHAFTDEYRSPAYGADVARGIWLALAHPGRTFHLGGPERLSRYAFALMACLVFGHDPRLVVPALQADVPMPAPRPKDVSLASSAATSIGFSPLPPVDALTLIRSNMY